MTFNATLDFYFLSSSISFGKTLKNGTTIGGPFIFIAALALVIISQKSNVSILTSVTNWATPWIFSVVFHKNAQKLISLYCQGSRAPLVNWRSLGSRRQFWKLLALLQLETFGWDTMSFSRISLKPQNTVMLFLGVILKCTDWLTHPENSKDQMKIIQIAQ